MEVFWRNVPSWLPNIFKTTPSNTLPMSCWRECRNTWPRKRRLDFLECTSDGLVTACSTNLTLTIPRRVNSAPTHQCRILLWNILIIHCREETRTVLSILGEWQTQVHDRFFGRSEKWGTQGMEQRRGITGAWMVQGWRTVCSISFRVHLFETVALKFACREGICTRWWEETGKVMGRYSFRGGVLEGESTEYYRNGDKYVLLPLLVYLAFPILNS